MQAPFYVHPPGTNCLGCAIRCRPVANTLIVIPARLQATRLPGKPMLDIAGVPMIVQVWRRAVAADAGRVVVATDSADVVTAVEAAGGEAVMTRDDHVSGSDRIFEAITRVDADARADFIVNLQGDLPTLEPHLVAACLAPLAEPAADIATLAAQITDEHERTNPNVVKVVGSPLATGRLRALYFTRATAPWARGRFIITSASTPIAGPRCPLRVAATFAPRAAREAGATARPGGRHAHRRQRR